MNDVLITESALRQVREVCRSIPELKLGQVMEAVASGLGYRTYAGLQSVARSLPVTGLAAQWQRDAFLARMATLDQASSRQAHEQAVVPILNALQVPRTELGFLSDIAAHLHAEGGGRLSVVDNKGEFSLQLATSHRKEGEEAMVSSCVYSSGQLGCVLLACSGRSNEPIGGMHTGQVSPRLLGLPRDSFPVGYAVQALPLGKHGFVMTIATPVSLHRGVDGLGVDGLDAGTLKQLIAASDPMVCLIGGKPNQGKSSAAFVAALASSRNPHAGDRTFVDLSFWEHQHGGKPGRVETAIRKGSLFDHVERLNGRCSILMPTLTDADTAKVANKLARMGALVWLPVDGHDAEDAKWRAQALGVAAECSTLWWCPRLGRPAPTDQTMDQETDQRSSETSPEIRRG